MCIEGLVEGTPTELLVLNSGASSVGLLGVSRGELDPVLTRHSINQRIVASISSESSAVVDPAPRQVVLIQKIMRGR